MSKSSLSTPIDFDVSEGLPVAAPSSHPAASMTQLSARLEPFDSYWQAPADVDRGYKSFSTYYRANYLGHIPADRDSEILVISCGPGYPGRFADQERISARGRHRLGPLQGRACASPRAAL